MPDVLTPTEIDSLPIPASMRQRPQWGVWIQSGKRKIPYSPKTRSPTDPTDAGEWCTFEEAQAELIRGNGLYAGLGFILTPQDSYTAIDLDMCRNPHTGEIELWAHEIVTQMHTYTEVSPSETGLHLYLQGHVVQSLNWKLAKSQGAEKGPGIEIYGQKHYLTVTGDHLPWTPPDPVPQQDKLNTLYADICTLRDLAKANRWTRALIGGDMDRYHNDESEAAYALIRDLINVVGKDAERIERLFRLTRLHRAKDDEPRGATTWLQYSIAKGIETYQDLGDRHTPDMSLDVSGGREAPQVGETPQWCGVVVRRLSAVQLRQPKWLWEPILPRGFLTILAGDGGTGKSTVASLIAARLTRGEHPYTGEPTGTPETVIIATSEDDHAMMLKPRMEAYKADQERIVTVMPVPSVKDPQRWKSLLHDYRPALVVVDPLQEALGGNLDENKASQTRAALRPFLPLVEEYDCTFLFLAHLGKDATEKKAQHRVLGSVDIGAIMRSILIIEESGYDGHYVIEHVKGNLVRRSGPLAYQIVPYEIAPGWEVGIAEWEETATSQYIPKKELGLSLVTACLKEHGGECERKAAEDHLAEHNITGGTAKRVLADPRFETEAGRIRIRP
jgi:AAA domain/NrS-1  polymerase HBD domain